MPRFRYEAVNRWGDPLAGEREAADVEALKATLGAEGLEVRAVEPAPDDYPRLDPARIAVDPFAAPPAPTGFGRPAGDPIDGVPADPPRRPDRARRPPRPARGLTDDEARELVEQIAGLSAAGLPLDSGLRAAAEELDDGALRRVLLELADRLAEGRPPDEAIEAACARIPPHLRGLVMAAVGSGSLGRVLGEFVRYARIGGSLRRALWLSLAYPILLVGALGATLIFAGGFIVPGFKSIYQDFGISLPSLTTLVIRASDLVVERGLEIAVLMVVSVLIAWVSALLLLDATSRRRLVHAIPLFGPLWRWTALAEFSHYLGLLVDCELSLGRALRLAAQGARDPELEWACEHVADEIEAGRPLSDALSWWQAIPRGLVKLLKWSEGHQSLGDALHMAGAMFEARARAQAAFIGATSVVVAVVLVLWGAALLVVALFLPLVRLISVLA